MKKMVLFVASFLLVFALAGTAQTLAPDQNPSYMVSQMRYMKMADSINSWHGTTPQETYKAIDYLEDRRELRATRREWRRELRMERARNSGWYYNGYNYGYSPYYDNYSGYGYYYNRPYYGYSRNHWNNYLWGAVPLAATLGWWWRR